MCTVSIDIDEVAIRDLLPELDSTAAIRLWAQELIDSRMHQMRLEDEETMSVEDARNMVLETVRKEYARPCIIPLRNGARGKSTRFMGMCPVNTGTTILKS